MNRNGVNERTANIPQVAAGTVVALVLGLVLLSMLAWWAIAQMDGVDLLSANSLSNHFCRYTTC